VLLTTQYLDEADALADELVVIDQGRVIATGTSSELKARIGSQTLEMHADRDGDLPLLEELIRDVTGFPRKLMAGV